MDSGKLELCVGSFGAASVYPDKYPDADMSVRAHEAGHILVALVNGYKVTKTVIGKTSAESVTVLTCSLEQGASYWERAMIACAGKVAEKLLFCLPLDEELHGGDSDDALARNLIKEFLISSGPVSQHDPELLTHKIDSVLSACYEAVNGVLFRYYTELYDLTQLLKSGELTFQELCNRASAFPSLCSLPVFQDGSSHS